MTNPTIPTAAQIATLTGSQLRDLYAQLAGKTVKSTNTVWLRAKCTTLAAAATAQAAGAAALADPATQWGDAPKAAPAPQADVAPAPRPAAAVASAPAKPAEVKPDRMAQIQERAVGMVRTRLEGLAPAARPAFLQAQGIGVLRQVARLYKLDDGGSAVALAARIFDHVAREEAKQANAAKAAAGPTPAPAPAPAAEPAPSAPKAPSTGRGGRSAGAGVVGLDPRIPAAGTVITKLYKGVEHKVTILADGVEHKGTKYRNLRQVVKVITGKNQVFSLLFFGLVKGGSTGAQAKAPRAAAGVALVAKYSDALRAAQEALVALPPLGQCTPEQLNTTATAMRQFAQVCTAAAKAPQAPVQPEAPAAA